MRAGADILPGQPEPGWPIAEVARRLGVSAATLRSWEVRYGLGPSARTAGGHRRYSLADLAALQRLLRLVGGGLPTAAAAASVRQRPSPAAGRADQRTAASTAELLRTRMRSAADALDAARAHRTARAVVAEFGPTAGWLQVFVPHLQHVGEQWRRRAGGVACEHVSSTAVMQVLDHYVATHRPATRSRSLLLASTEAEHHTLPLHAAAAALAERRIASSLLGRLPAAALQAAVDALQPSAVVLFSRGAGTRDLGQLGNLGGRVPLLCAAGLGWGNEARSFADRAVDLPALIDLLDSWTG